MWPRAYLCGPSRGGIRVNPLTPPYPLPQTMLGTARAKSGRGRAPSRRWLNCSRYRTARGEQDTCPKLCCKQPGRSRRAQDVVQLTQTARIVSDRLGRRRWTISRQRSCASRPFAPAQTRGWCGCGTQCGRAAVRAIAPEASGWVVAGSSPISPRTFRPPRLLTLHHSQLAAAILLTITATNRCCAFTGYRVASTRVSSSGQNYFMIAFFVHKHTSKFLTHTSTFE